jgi:3-oxoacyl-[acyl-carrier protein] reductase
VNAGVGTAGPVAQFPMKRLTKSMRVNFVAPFTLIQASVPLLRRWAEQSANGAKVVALASITGVYPEPGLAAYGATKAALLSLVETVNREEISHGITASAVAPGYVDTDMSAWVTDTIPASEMIPVADVVAVVDMLVNLSRHSSIPRVVMARSASTGYEA